MEFKTKDVDFFIGKIALVTGAGKGIGRAIAVSLANHGAKVFAISRTQADLDDLKKEGPGIETRQVDLADWYATRQVIADLGPIDLLVNNAGIIQFNLFLDVPETELDTLHNVNFKAAFNVAQVVAQGMASRGTGGSIVNMTSVAGITAAKNHTSYCTSKAALEMLTKVMALELGEYKIRVNSVSPTVVMTAMGKKAWSDPDKRQTLLSRTPIGDLPGEQDVVDAVQFLLSDKSSFVTGSSLSVDGGVLVSSV